MDIRGIGRGVHVALLLLVAFGCVVLSIFVAEFAFTWWGHPCSCVPSGLSSVGSLCVDSCISIGPLSVGEGPGRLVLALALPVLGTAVGEAVLRSGSEGD